MNATQLLTTAVLGAGALTANSKNLQNPNILFILVDDLGYSDVSYMGNKQEVKTPNIDKLASQGVVFDNAYAACPVSSPSRASIMTGKSPAALNLTCHIPGVGMQRYNKLRNKGRKLKEAKFIDHLPLEEFTIAELLKKKDYRTGFMGKWHLAGEGSIKTKNGIVNSKWHPDAQGFDLSIAACAYGQSKRYFSPYKNGTIHDGEKGEYLTNRLTDEAMNFMKSSKSAPFFCMLSYYTVHRPHKVPQKYIKQNGGDKHLAMISCLDDNVGRIAQFLKANDLDENTIVIFYSDNGGIGKNPPLRDYKGSLYEGGIRVPLIIKYPGINGNRKINHSMVTSYDFLPTLASFAGGDYSQLKNIEGQDISKSVLLNKEFVDRDLFWHFPHHRENDKSMGAAVRSGNWKLIYEFEKDEFSLFDLSKDIGETNNLAKQMPQKLEELNSKLKNWQKSVKAVFPEKNNKQ
jgi:arylsulfatase A-like enzyme